MKEFQAAFQISEHIIFEVEYYTLSTNKNPYFATSAECLTGRKLDFDSCGQAQDDLLIWGRARDFWLKWDKYHLKDLTPAQYSEMICDLEELKTAYNYIFDDLSNLKKPYSPHISFTRIVELSNKKIKRTGEKE